MLSFFMSVSLLLPTLPLYIRDLGGSPVDIGLVIGVFSIGVLVVRPLVGHLIDTRGRRGILLLGSILSLAMAPLYAWWTPLALLIVVRIVHGVGLSAHTGAATTLVADFTPPSRRTEFMGYFSAASVISLAIGAPLGIEIANRFGYTWVFIAVGITSAVALAFGFAIDEPDRPPRHERGVRFLALLRRRNVAIPSMALLLATLTTGGVLAFLPILLEQRRPEDFGLFFAINAVSSLGARLGAGKLSRYAGDGPMIWGGLVIHAIGIFSLTMIQGLLSMFVAAMLSAVGFAIFWPGLYGLVVNSAPDMSRGVVLNFFLAAFDLGMGLGGLASGPIVARVGIPSLFVALSAIPVLAAGIFVATLGWRPVATPEPPWTEP